MQSQSINEHIVFSHNQYYNFYNNYYTQILKEYVELENTDHDVCYPLSITLEILPLYMHTSSSSSPLIYEMPVKGISNISHVLLRAKYELIQPETHSVHQFRQPETTHHDNISCKPCHHGVLYRQLSRHAAEWREIGEQLGFQPCELDIIKAESQEGPKCWLSAMLDKWLQWAPGDGRGSQDYATLNSLKIAVSAVGLGRTAEELSLSNK